VSALFATSSSEHPVIATKLLTNLSRELARQLRRTSEDLRNRTRAPAALVSRD